MINEIKRRLEAGEEVELECIDRQRFVVGEFKEINNKILARKSLVVKSVSAYSHFIYLEEDIEQVDAYVILQEELKYFKIKESKKTFHDLVGVAVQAVKDGVIFSTEIFEDAIYICLDRSEYDTRNPSIGIVDGLEADMKEIPDIISKINTIYTETFVVEDYTDIKRIKNGGDIKLANGLQVKAYDDPERYSEGWAVKCADGKQSGTLDIFALKGATVTQEKTNN